MSLISGAIFIMCCRVIDVSLGTLRTLSVVKGYKYLAAFYGFIEVTIWVIAIRHIMLNLDNLWNLLGYSTGFALGNIIGITIENKFGKGFIQIYIVSMHHAEKIAAKLRRAKVGVTLLPGEGTRGGVAIIVVIISSRRKKEVVSMAESVDPAAFISIQPSIPYRGYFHSRG